jgi:natural product biosynthesis luciferase-like monooxygenase protein
MTLAFLLAGSQPLTRHCGEAILARGHRIVAVLTGSADLARWAGAAGLRVEPPDAGAAARLAGIGADWLISAAGRHLLPEALLALARCGAASFHDAPLPRHAGLHAPVWAILAGEAEHGVVWQRIEAGAGAGAILAERRFAIAPGDTALTLNARCLEAGIESFAEFLAGLEAGTLAPRPQDGAMPTRHGAFDRPAAAARLDWRAPAAALCRLVRALDHGGGWNPLAAPRIDTGAEVLLVGAAEPAPGEAAAGTVLAATPAGLTVACADGAVRLSRLTDTEGRPRCPATVAAPGALLPPLADGAAITAALAAIVPGEARHRAALRELDPIAVALAGPATGDPAWQGHPVPGLAALPPLRRAVAVALFAASLGEGDLALADAAAPARPGYVSGWVPLRLPVPAAPDDPAPAAALAQARRHPAFAADLPARDAAIGPRPRPQAAVGFGTGPLPFAALTVEPEAGLLHLDRARIAPEAAAILAARLAHIAAALAEGRMPGLAEAERAAIAGAWNRTAAPVAETTIHAAIAAQAAATPAATALIVEDRATSHAALDAAANRAAHLLRGLGVGPGVPVALCTRRNEQLVIGALAILKAGGAYVPMDPAYPAERLALYLADSGAAVVVTEAAVEPALPPGPVRLLLDADPRLAAAPATAPAGGAGPADLAYVIYTSGSTGRPKGVMVEHRNVANFFAGMDARIPHAPGDTWLAVTSLSFDISVLELFWTLARGFRVVLMGEHDRATVAQGRAGGGERIDFSLCYWGNDDSAGPRKYDLMLEGARFAAAHGFAAVWTPERHFHAFGGPYPNPAVTGAAIAAVAPTLSVRAGSCVAPLHHPARIAEDWAVIDNLTGGRAGIAFAAGWQPEDFVLRPENTPPANRAAMFAALDQVRALWRGEAVEFPTATGRQAVVTQPRPVSAELAAWITTAGNPETWREAGARGAHVLTHLLGQSIAEVGERIALYRAARAAAGHDPATGIVTLMLHTFLAETREAARAAARGPLRAYLRSAAGLIKQYAWAFPAFKRPAGIASPEALDLRDLSEDEMEGILDFAFARYFDDQGLFGTVGDALARVEQLRAIGVNEIACLIDYGIPAAGVLAGLRPLADLVARANAEGPAAGDFSIAAQIVRHGVTHLQCTPSMARMIAGNAEARAALAHLRQLLIGGEALPGTLVAELRRATAAAITNMYGPTETTIWSTTGPADAAATIANIGTPIANTQVHVLDGTMQPLPVGRAGELWIGGAGLARGYWQRPDLTAERFVATPLGRLYRTGDLVRWRADGRLDFLGRADGQVKLRGYRIEPGEIEALAEALPGVGQAVAVAREDVPGDVRLVLYVSTAPGFDAARLAGRLAAALPAHMVPAHIVPLAAMPLTPNRKIDRKALPPPQAAAAPPAAHVAPEGSTAETIAAIWARVLNVPRVGTGDNFFALGGHSLLAVQAHREIRAALGAPGLSITDLFRFPVLADLAAHLAPRPALGPAPEDADRAAARAAAMAQRRALRAARGGG